MKLTKTNSRAKAQILLDDWYEYKSAKPMDHVFDIQEDKDELQQSAYILKQLLLWSDDLERIADISHIFENKLQQFKEKIIIELLK